MTKDTDGVEVNLKDYGFGYRSSTDSIPLVALLRDREDGQASSYLVVHSWKKHRRDGKGFILLEIRERTRTVVSPHCKTYVGVCHHMKAMVETDLLGDNPSVWYIFESMAVPTEVPGIEVTPRGSNSHHCVKRKSG